jgi:tripartite ATP-independent transporter DctM subunit
MKVDPWFPELTFGGVQKLHSVMSALSLPILILLIVSAVFGTPIFVILGGAALLFFFRTGGQLSSVADEAYIMLKGENIPAIPLFTLVGFILSESKAGERLVRLFRALLGWMPGGLAVMSVLVCAFFTIFTGASGVTILAIGGLLSFVLVQSRYQKDYSLGLLTSSGSIGLLFFPSIPLIMYGVTAQISIKEMGIGGLLPGLIMVVTVCLLGIRYAFKSRVDRTAFQPYEIIPTLNESKWEILLPWVVLVSYFTGATTLVETAALAVAYVLIIEVIVHRDIKIRQLPQVFLKCIPIIGGVLIILTAAKGLSFFFVDQQIPTRLVEWFQNAISSKYVFLIMLNLALLVTGCFMDIFSAITVVAPLIIPLGVAYGIHPVHLGIIFLANLELGYLTPPVGINLFLASYRFNEPLSKIYRQILPFFLPRLAAVLLITYVPWFTTWLLKVIRL